MIVLSLDSTTRAGSAALLDAERVVDQRIGDSARAHAVRLPSDLTQLLDAHGLTVADVDLFAVASGPGSFTGLRIGIATMQALALVRGRPLIGISALEALAEAGLPQAGSSGVVAAWMDAYRREVFTTLYKVERPIASGVGRLIEVEGARVDDPAATLARWKAAGVIGAGALFIGDGAVLYGRTIAEAIPDARVFPAPPLAAIVGRLAAARAAAGEGPHPAALQPLYVRRPDAEVARDKARR